MQQLFQETLAKLKYKFQKSRGEYKLETRYLGNETFSIR